MSSLPSTVYKIHHLLRKSWLTLKKLRCTQWWSPCLTSTRPLICPPPPSTTVKQSQRGLGVYYSSVSKVHIIPIRNWDGSPATMFKKKKRQQKQCRGGKEIGGTLGFASQLDKPSCQVPGPCERTYHNKTDWNNRTKQLGGLCLRNGTWVWPPAPCTHTCIHMKTKPNRIPHQHTTGDNKSTVYPERAL